MAHIFPFSAVHPTNDKVSLVTCRAYEEYSQAELAAYLDFNPFSFLHVLKPAYANQHTTSPEKRFRQVAQKYHDFHAEDVLTKETRPAFYLYEIRSRNKVFTGIVAAASIEDYKNNIIKKHENTLEYRVEMFKEYLHLTGFHTEPVLITYPDNHEINSWIASHKHENKLFEFSTTKKEKHTLWAIPGDEDIKWLQQKFDSVDSIYIADGHHRMASSALLYDQYKDGNDSLKHFLTFLIAESDVSIYEFNRVIRDLNKLTKDDFLKMLSDRFLIRSKGHELWKPVTKFEFGMYLAGEFYSLTLKDTTHFRDIAESLDAQILYDLVLRPILGINDLRNDERIDYIPGNQSISTFMKAIDEGEFEVGFLLFPASISEIKLLADNGLIMPPKSTYIEPKFRSGLLIYEL